MEFPQECITMHKSN